MLSARLTGGDRLKRRLAGLTPALKKPVAREINAGALAVHGEMVRAIQSGPKTGRVYKRRSVRHQASAPGEAPATDTGSLVGSLAIEPDPDGLGTKVLARSGYAMWLEFGTRRMAARPFFQRSFELHKKKIRRAIGAAVKAALKAAAKG